MSGARPGRKGAEASDAGPLAALVAALQAEGGLLAGAVSAPDAHAPAPHGAIAGAGPRARGQEAAYAQVVEAVREGHLAHTGVAGASRFVTTGDEDLALLVGDRLYALGLSTLAQIGDLDAVAELAQVILLGAQAQATGERELGEAAWEAGAHAVGHGTSPALQRAQAAARDGAPSAASALRAAARQLAAAGANTPTPPNTLTPR